MHNHETSREVVREIASIELYVRVRPLAHSERDDKKLRESILVSKDHKELYVQMTEKMYRMFSFDHIFSEASKNVEIYNKCCQIQVERFLAGSNASIFAYGQSGTGKTYTMGLLDKINGHSDGLVPLSLRFIFAKLNSMKDHQISLSMVQVYRDDVYDLFSKPLAPVTIREDSETKIFFLQGLVIVPITNDHQAFELINEGLCRRPMASQSLNPTSSRSHLIITLYLRHRFGNDPQSTKVVSKLTFVDLAGSERVSKSESKGLRLEEARAINSSLSALADAICHLKYYNDTFLFRNSKLTKSLQMSLMGQSYICVLGMVRKSPQYTSETVGTLNFIRKCKSMKLGDPTQFSYQEIYPDGRATKPAIQSKDNPLGKPTASMLLATNPSRETMQVGRETSDDGGFLFREEPERSVDDRRRDVNGREVGEFAQFVGMCLINISRMLKKLCLEVCNNAGQEDIEELLSERYGYDGADGIHQGKMDIIQPIPEEMLIDLRDAQNVPEIVSLVQGAFKLLIEQIKETSNRAATLTHHLLNTDERAKNEKQLKLNQQFHGFLKEFSHVLSKIVNQLIITKFETLSNLTDSKQTLPIMQHFVDFPLCELLQETESAVRHVLGGDIARNLTEQLQGVIKQLFFSLTGSRNFTISELALHKRCKDSMTQTDKSDLPVVSGVSRGIQAEQTCKSFSAQVSDHTEEKLIGLIEAHRRLQADRNWIIQERDAKYQQLGLRIQVLEQENPKVQELQNENRTLKSHLIQLEKNCHEEQSRFASDTQGLLSQLASSRDAIQSLERRLESTLQQSSQLQSAKASAEEESKRLSRQVSELTSKLQEVEDFHLEQREMEISSELESLKENYGQILEKSREALSKAQEESAQHKRHLEESLRRQQQLISTNTSLAAQLEQSQVTLEELSRAHNAMQEKTAQLERDLEDKGGQINQHEEMKLREQMKQLQLEVDEHKRTEELLKSAQQLASSTTASLQDQISSLSAELSACQREKDQLTHTLEALRTDLSKKDSKDSEFREKLEAKTRECRQSQEEYGYRIRDLEIEKNKAVETKNSLAAKLEKVEVENTGLRAKLATAEEEARALASKLENEGVERAEVEIKMKELMGRVGKVEGEKTRNERVIEEEEQEIARLTQRCAELEKANSEARKKSHEVSTKLDKAEKELSKKDIKIAEIDLSKTTIDKQLQEARDEIRRAKDELRESKVKITDFEERLQEKQEALTLLQSKYENSETQAQALINQNNELEHFKHESEHKLLMLQQESIELSSQLKLAEDQLRAKSSKQKEQSSKIQELTQQLTQTSSLLQQLQQHSNLNHDSQTIALNRNIETLTHSLEEKNSQIVELQATIEQLKSSLEDSKRDATQSHSKLKETLKKLSEMVEETRKLSKEVEDLKSLKQQLSTVSAHLATAKEELHAKSQRVESLSEKLSSQQLTYEKQLTEREEAFQERLGLAKAEWSQQREQMLKLQDEKVLEYERKLRLSEVSHGAEVQKLEQQVARFHSELKDREHEGLSAKSGAITALEDQIKKLEAALVEVRMQKTLELETLHKKFDTDMQVLNSNHANETDVLRSQLTDQATSYVKELRFKEEVITQLQTNSEAVTRAFKDAEQKAAEKKKVIADMEKKIEVLIGMNQQLAAKLSEKSQSELSKNKYKRSQGSIPRSDSYSKHASAVGQASHAYEGPHPHGGGALPAKVSNNLISNFDKLVAVDLSTQDHTMRQSSHHSTLAQVTVSNKENQQLNNKEAGSSRPKIPQKPNELLKDVLVERKVLIAIPPDRDRPEDKHHTAGHQGLLAPAGAGRFAGANTLTLAAQDSMRASMNHHLYGHANVSPQKGAAMVQSGPLIGLHQLEPSAYYHDTSNTKPSEFGHNQPVDPKIYSSKYSRGSRNSRNSYNSNKRSPSPGKATAQKESPPQVKVLGANVYTDTPL